MLRCANLPLWILVAAYFVLGSLYLRATPAWRTPDEFAHVRVIAQIAAEGCCPSLEISAAWDDYEDHQPALYYLLLTPVYLASNGDLVAMRFASLLIGSGALIAAWFAMRATFTQQLWVALGTAAFIAFLPQRLAMMVGVNNDALAETLAASLLALCLYWLRPNARLNPIWIGVLLGVCFVTKLTLYPLAAAVGVALLLKARRATQPFRTLIRSGLAVALPAALIGGVFWLRNISVYGFPDFLAQQRHDLLAVHVSQQPTTEQWIERLGVTGWLEAMIGTTFQSFWGQFGEMAVPMQSSTYQVLHFVTFAAVLGAVFTIVTRRKYLSSAQRDMLWVLGAALVAVVGTFFYYNLKFVQFQGRYLYPALLPIALCYTVGIVGIGRLVRALLPQQRRQWVNLTVICVLFGVGMAAFAVYALYRVLIPFLV